MTRPRAAGQNDNAQRQNAEAKATLKKWANLRGEGGVLFFAALCFLLLFSRQNREENNLGSSHSRYYYTWVRVICARVRVCVVRIMHRWQELQRRLVSRLEIPIADRLKKKNQVSSRRPSWDSKPDCEQDFACPFPSLLSSFSQSEMSRSFGSISWPRLLSLLNLRRSTTPSDSIEVGMFF